MRSLHLPLSFVLHGSNTIQTLCTILDSWAKQQPEPILIFTSTSSRSLSLSLDAPHHIRYALLCWCSADI